MTMLDLHESVEELFVEAQRLGERYNIDYEGQLHTDNWLALSARERASYWSDKSLRVAYHIEPHPSVVKPCPRCLKPAEWRLGCRWPVHHSCSALELRVLPRPSAPLSPLPAAFSAKTSRQITPIPPLAVFPCERCGWAIEHRVGCPRPVFHACKRRDQ